MPNSFTHNMNDIRTTKAQREVIISPVIDITSDFTTHRPKVTLDYRLCVCVFQLLAIFGSDLEHATSFDDLQHEYEHFLESVLPADPTSVLLGQCVNTDRACRQEG